MRLRRTWRIALIAPMSLALALATANAFAWGPKGHQAVGAIADQLLAGTATGKKVRQVLGGSLQTASAWADCARAVESRQGTWSYTGVGTYRDCAVFENPASEHALIDFVQRNASRCGGFSSSAQCRHKAYHFVDLPLQHPRYDPALPGTAPNDLVHAINAAITVLKGGKSPAPFDIRGPREALRLLAHYVGDMHQPLHVGAIYLDDAGQPLDPATPQEAREHGNAGGNQIVLDGKKLHALWDDLPDKLFKPMLAGPGAVQAKKVARTAGAPLKWSAAWAGESTAQAAKVYAGLKIGKKSVTLAGAEWEATATEPAYRLSREAMQKEQLVKGGARLAQILKALWP
jgi:S1/P1 Nuclease